MGKKSKQNGPSKKTTKATSKRTAPAEAIAPPAVTIATRTLRFVHVSDAARTAFGAQTSNEERTALASRTRARDTLSCVGGWISIAHGALAQFKNTIRYSPARLAFLCESTLVLADAIDHAQGGRAGKKTAASRLEALRIKAAHLRSELLEALGEIARGDNEATDSLYDVSREDRDGDLVAALTTLASVAQSYLGRAANDDALAALVEGVISQADVTAANETAAALTTASVGKTDAGLARTSDAPEVNLAEGLVLAEMRVVRRAFQRAHERDNRVPRLVPTAPLRKLFGFGSARDDKAPVVPTQPNATNGAPVTT